MSALGHFVYSLRSANSHPLAAFLSFEGADALGIGPDWGGMVEDLEAEGSALIGAVPCPDGVPHGWEPRLGPQAGVLIEGYAQPCPSCGAVL